jgi:hypothetical protein
MGWSVILSHLKMPGAILGALLAVGVVAEAFGFSVVTPGSNFESYKSGHTERHDVLDSSHAEVHRILRDTIVELDGHMHEQLTLTEALIKGECLESKASKLARQGLINKCSSLGIRRTVGDVIDRELDNP